MKLTTAFKEGNIEESGWTSQYSFLPDWCLKLNNRFFTIKNGQLYIHNDRSNPNRNVFYGVQYPSTVTTVFNDFNADDKIFKTLVLESDSKWKADLLTNYTVGVIEANEFNTRESRQFSFIRGNESNQSFNGNSVQGLGSVLSFSLNTITYSLIPDLVSVGDVLMQINGEIHEQIGVVAGINRITAEIEIIAYQTLPSVGFFCYAKKNNRIEGEEIRGHYLEVKLSNDEKGASELLAVSTNAVKSYV